MEIRNLSYRSTLPLILIMTAMTLLLSGCEDESVTEQVEDTTLTGSWLMSSVVLHDTPFGDMTFSSESFLEMSGTGAVASILTLNEDGSAEVTTKYVDAADETETGTWQEDGDNLIIGGAGINGTVAYLLQNTSLTLTMIMPIDFYEDGTPEDTAVDMIYDKITE